MIYLLFFVISFVTSLYGMESVLATNSLHGAVHSWLQGDARLGEEQFEKAASSVDLLLQQQGVHYNERNREEHTVFHLCATAMHTQRAHAQNVLTRLLESIVRFQSPLAAALAGQNYSTKDFVEREKTFLKKLVQELEVSYKRSLKSPCEIACSSDCLVKNNGPFTYFQCRGEHKAGCAASAFELRDSLPFMYLLCWRQAFTQKQQTIKQ